MARPLKSGLDYFPLDISFDDTVELLEAEFGLEGFAILIKVWQKIYANGYYLTWNDDTTLLFSKKINTEKDKVISVINTCLHRDLFNKSMCERFKILTSSGIQKRYITACVSSKRKSIAMEERYLLIDDKYKKLITELIPLIKEETPLNPEESTQRKGKERKGNREESNSVSSTRFIPPTLDEVKTYCIEKHNNVDAEKWWYFYDSKNWMIGKTKMSKWKSAIATWKNIDKDKPKQNNIPQSVNFKQREYSDEHFESLYKNGGGKK